MNEFLISIEIDGRTLEARKGAMLIEVAGRGGHRDPAVLLSQEALGGGQLPYVPGGGGEGAETAAGLRDTGDGRYEGVHALEACVERAEIGDGVSAHQPSPGLPDLRSGR